MRHYLSHHLIHAVVGIVCFWLGYQSYIPNVYQLVWSSETSTKQVVVQRKYVCPSNDSTDDTFARSSYSREWNVSITKDPDSTLAGLRLYAWADWNQDGDWNDASEQIISNTSANSSTQSYSVSIPPLRGQKILLQLPS